MKGFSIGKAIAKGLSHGNVTRPKGEPGQLIRKTSKKLKKLY